MQVDRSLLRHLPAIDHLKQRACWQPVATSDATRTAMCRDVIAQARAAVDSGQITDAASLLAHVDTALARAVAQLRGPILRRVLNGLGVLVHTNAGRAPLSDAALARVVETTGAYCNLELSLETGLRGSRQDLLRDPMRWLFDAEDALVVNNGAAAIMLVLHALSAGRPTFVSRGELVEIGGSFRVPDVMSAAGAILVEVGTTNRTWPRDYGTALDAHVAAQTHAAQTHAAQPHAALAQAASTPAAVVLQVHRSNFRVEGFVHTPTVAELAALAHERGVPLVVDLGSGVVDDLTRWGLQPEPTVRETLAAGADVVTFSGDKLLGGPQAGLIVGKRRWLRQIGANAMARAVRVDGMVLAALEATLRSHLRGRATAELPLWQAMDLDQAALLQLGEGLADRVRLTVGADWDVALAPSEATVGGGAQPGAVLPSWALTLRQPGRSAAALATALRLGEPAVLARPRDLDVWLDLRSLFAGARADLPAQLCAALALIEGGAGHGD